MIMQAENELRKKFRLHEKDTGSTAYQIILLNEEITKEKIHLVNNKKDVPVKRALLKNIAKKKKFFLYLKKNNPDQWSKLRKEIK